VFDMLYNFNHFTGNLTSRQDNNKQLHEGFTYDLLDRLSTAQWTNWATNTSQATPTSYKLDGLSYTSLGNFTENSSLGYLQYNAGQKIHSVNMVFGFNNTMASPPNPLKISELDQDILYTPFNKTEKILEDDSQIDFTYDAGYQRVKSVYKSPSGDITEKIYLDDYEIVKNPQGNVTKIHYMYGGDGLCALITTDDIIPALKIHYVYTDHVGSIAIVTNEAGNVVEAEQSFDAWGQRRDPNDWAIVYPSLAPPQNPDWLFRGYTGHEHHPQFGLINMNGRMYDPALGRMCSPDKYIADATSTQAYNRYSYANNNPLKYTDPDGQLAHIVVGAILGGVINLGIKYSQGKIGGWEDGLAAFGIGALAGAIGAATGGAAFAAAGGGAALGLGGFLAGAVSGSVGSFYSTPIQSIGNSVYFGDPMMTTADLAKSVGIGGLTGGVFNGALATFNSKNFWNGDLPTSNLRVDMTRLEMKSIKAIGTSEVTRTKFNTLNTKVNNGANDMEKMATEWQSVCLKYGADPTQQGFRVTMPDGLRVTGKLYFGGKSNPAGWNIKVTEIPRWNLPHVQPNLEFNNYLRYK
jgi:RHS repeat-associated protein